MSNTNEATGLDGRSNERGIPARSWKDRAEAISRATGIEVSDRQVRAVADFAIADGDVIPIPHPVASTVERWIDHTIYRIERNGANR